MTTRTLARFFNVNFDSYHKWIKQFDPFGKDQQFDLGSIKKKKMTRFDIGTEVPVPINNPEFMALHRGRPVRRKSQRHLDMESSASIFLSFALTVNAAFHTLSTRKNYTDASHSPQRDRWLDSMNAEYS